MSDENRVNEAEANTEEQPVAETPTGEDAPVLEESPEEGSAQAVADTDGDSEDAAVAEAEVEAVAETEAEAVTEAETEAAAESEVEAAAETEVEATTETEVEATTETEVEAVAETEAEAATEPEVEAVAEAEAEAATEPEVEAVAETEAEAATEPEVEAVAETEAEAAAEAVAEVASVEADTDSGQEEQQARTLNRVEGPAIFNRAKQGNQRRNPRHVGNDVRIDEIDYKNIQVLSRFVDNYGRIHNRRKTRVTAKLQRKVTRAIKRARHLALMPYTGEHIRITGRRG